MYFNFEVNVIENFFQLLRLLLFSPIGYMPRNKPTVEYVTVTADGFRYRGRVHANTFNLLKWFKEHFRDPVPGAGKKDIFFIYMWRSLPEL